MAMPIFGVAHDTVEGESALALIVVIMVAFGPMLVAGLVTLILGIVLLCISKKYNDKFSAALKFIAPFLIVIIIFGVLLIQKTLQNRRHVG